MATALTGTLPPTVLAAVATHTADAVVITDGAGEIRWVNAAFERLTGYPPAEALGAQPERLLQGEGTDRLQTMRLRAAILSGDPWRGELDHHRRDGTPFRHEISVAPVPGMGETFRLWLGRDASERRTLARRFLDLAAVVELSRDGIVVLDDRLCIRIANSAYARLVGRDSGAELEGLDWRALQTPEALAHFDQVVLSRLGIDAGWQGELPGRRTDGHEFPTEVSISLLSGGIAIVVRDITERVAQEEALQRLSVSDALTGLYNRRGFELLAHQQLTVAARAHTGALLLYCDLDRFKAINDTHGHAVGDEALVEVASLLRATVRESDLVGRLGGDEFVVLAVNTQDADGSALVERLEEQLRLRNARADARYQLSIGWGVARFDPASPRSLAALLEEADTRLLARKRARGAVR